MKVVAFNGSARKNGNTAILINCVLDELMREGIETELVQFAGKNIRGCIACYKCIELKDRRCAIHNDIMNDCIEKMMGADGIVFGSPVYFADLTAGIKGFIERAGMVGRANGDLFRRKVGAAVTSVRRAGAIHTFDSMNHFFFISQMIVPGSNYWNVGVGRDIGEVDKDEEGKATMRLLGQNMAWLIKKLQE
ncbi:MAG: flavodoxin family protein [Syntrophus sp. (in: bacteria)]|nr:flavodoxin family protein [Syntrophus sp. (in: bacteria)]